MEDANYNIILAFRLHSAYTVSSEKLPLYLENKQKLDQLIIFTYLLGTFFQQSTSEKDLCVYFIDTWENIFILKWSLFVLLITK